MLLIVAAQSTVQDAASTFLLVRVPCCSVRLQTKPNRKND